MSQTTQSNVNYVCNFSRYGCLRTLRIRSMSHTKVNHMGNLYWSTQIKVLCHLSICNKQQKVKKSSTSNHLVECPLSEIICIEIWNQRVVLPFAMFYLFISNLSHGSSRNHNALRSPSPSQLWHSVSFFMPRLLLRAITLIFLCLHSCTLPLHRQESIKELRIRNGEQCEFLGFVVPAYELIDGLMCGCYWAVPAFNVFQLFLLAYHKL